MVAQVNRVTVMSDWKGRSAPEAMKGLFVRSKTGAMVPVSALVDCEEELGPNAVYRYNRYLYCTVDMAQKAGVSLQDAMDEISRIFARELPRDYDTGWSGIAYEESSNPGRMTLVVALALPLVLSSGAGAAGSRSFGMALLGGYLAYALAGLPLAAALKPAGGRRQERAGIC